MGKTTLTHTILRNNGFLCTHCGSKYAVPFPIAVSDYIKRTDAFNILHGDCKKTWEEPKADLSTSVEERMAFWLEHGERGMSSEAMFEKISGKFINGSTNHPCDPDDFSRCYKLLEILPEWKLKLDCLQALSPTWEKLVNNWALITQLYEEKKYKAVYEVMMKSIKH